MKKKKLKLKKQVWYILIFIIFIGIGYYSYSNVKEKYKEEATIEYKLKETGYTEEEITTLKKYYSEKELNKFLNKKKDELLLEFLNHEHYIHENYDRYIKFKDESRLNVNDTIEFVNLNLDYDYYEAPVEVDYNLGNEILVNKYYLLNSEFVPNDLVQITNQKYYYGTTIREVRKEVWDNYLNMFNDSLEAGHYLLVQLGYYSYKDHEKLYNTTKENNGTVYADENINRPGSNEHQTGLAMDIFAKGATSMATFPDSNAYIWLKENAHKYGFIERYQKGKELITGFDAEPWHYRYVGVETATFIYNNDLTLEEYLTYYK